MTTKPSAAPWADEPFALIPTPPEKLANEKHYYLQAAYHMSDVHNVLIRGLNSIIQQGPCIPSASSPHYNAKDIEDFLTYVSIWTKTVHHHHSVEELFLFPEIERFSGKPGLMDDPKHQHESFQVGMERLSAYTTATKPYEYRWDGETGMKKIIDSFSEELIHHLRAEIDVFLSLKDLDSDGLKRTWDKGEAFAKKNGSLSMFYDIFPFVLGNADKTFKGGESFPPLPWIAPYIIKYWFAAGNEAFRFNPCDFWGQPRPLAFGPEK